MEDFIARPNGRATRTFVPALRDPQPQVIEVEATRILPAAPNTVLLPQANYTDRAHAFRIATMPLAGVVGVVAGLVAISAFSVPFLSVLALLIVLAGFALTWLCAYLAFVLISPDGAVFLSVVYTWAYLKREQIERIRRYRGQRQR